MKKLIAIVILLVEAYLIISFSRSVWGLWQRQEEIDRQRERVGKLLQENNRLQSQLTYVRTEEFIEKQAREKLNLVKPDETVVVVPESVLRAATASASPTPPPPNWEQWMRLFF